MSTDRHSALPVRTEADADERLQSKIIDYTDPSLGMEVDADKNAHVEVHGNNPAGGDEILRLSELGALTPDGVYDGTNNTKPGNSGVIVHQRNATPNDSHQTIRQTGISNDTKHCADISLHDENGTPYSATNPMYVAFTESEGSETHDPHEAVNVAKDGFGDHVYTAGADMLITGYHASGSGKMKAEVFVETAPSSGSFVSKYVHFNSTSSPDIDKILSTPIKLLNGQKIKMTKTNRDHDVQSLYSTFAGVTL